MGFTGVDKGLNNLMTAPAQAAQAETTPAVETPAIETPAGEIGTVPAIPG